MAGVAADRLKSLRPALALLGIAAAACGGSTGPAGCDPTAIEARFSGTWAVGGVVHPIILFGDQTKDAVSLQLFAFLRRVLIEGGETTGRSVVWTMKPTAPMDGVVQLQVQRTSAGNVPIVSALASGLPWGEGPMVSATNLNAAGVLLVIDNFFAATASGSISLSDVTPLAGNMVVEVRTQSGDSGRLAGSLSLRMRGPGC